MRTHRPTIVQIAITTGLWALLGACLPSATEGERGVQCWTEQATKRSECSVDFIWCLDDADPEDFGDLEDCTDIANRCAATIDQSTALCERRSGCIAERRACQQGCSGVVEVGECQQRCDLDFEQCAPWFDEACESSCLERALECAAESSGASETVRCENERLECVLECY
ncbi:MAG: hypothetical protein AAGF11_08830 [Myxococcota bacterium]